MVKRTNIREQQSTTAAGYKFDSTEIGSQVDWPTLVCGDLCIFGACASSTLLLDPGDSLMGDWASVALGVVMHQYVSKKMLDDDSAWATSTYT